MDEEIESCRREIDELKNWIEDKRVSDADPSALVAYGQENNIDSISVDNLRQRRFLRGHFGKIYSMDWSADSQHLVSASQDGKLIIWNAYSTNKLHAIPLRSSWVMTCSYSPSGSYVACGGLDNVCSIYRLPDVSDSVDTGRGHKTCVELQQHDGYISCTRFITDETILTSSGDSSVILWDTTTSQPLQIWNDHLSDVMSVSVNSNNQDIFISASCDASVKLYDIRLDSKSDGQQRSSAIMSYHGHESDINSVSFNTTGNVFGSGSDDSSCRVYDIRCHKELNRFSNDKVLCGITSVAFSHSSHVLYAGYDDYNVYLWDTISGDLAGQLFGHENRVSCLGVTQDGKALCTGSWDYLLKIWA